MDRLFLISHRHWWERVNSTVPAYHLSETSASYRAPTWMDRVADRDAIDCAVSPPHVRFLPFPYVGSTRHVIFEHLLAGTHTGRSADHVLSWLHLILDALPTANLKFLSQVNVSVSMYLNPPTLTALLGVPGSGHDISKEKQVENTCYYKRWSTPATIMLTCQKHTHKQTNKISIFYLNELCSKMHYNVIYNNLKII